MAGQWHRAGCTSAAGGEGVAGPEVDAGDSSGLVWSASLLMEAKVSPRLSSCTKHLPKHVTDLSGSSCVGLCDDQSPGTNLRSSRCPLPSLRAAATSSAMAERRYG